MRDNFVMHIIFIIKILYILYIFLYYRGQCQWNDQEIVERNTSKPKSTCC